MLMTGLPLVWGEKGPFDPGSSPARSYVQLLGQFDFEPIDVLDRTTLARGRLLFLAQPQRLAPAELAALDGWVRRGGRALILADPVLAWPSELPPGDIRRPPPVSLLGPLLHHWRLALDVPAEPREIEGSWAGRKILLDGPGRLRSASEDCLVGRERWTAVCRLGSGRVRVVADADLMRDDLNRRSANWRVVREWLDELAGPSARRRRAGAAGWTAENGGGVTFAAILLGVAAAIGLLLRRRRRR
jgi:hypothetical protein